MATAAEREVNVRSRLQEIENLAQSLEQERREGKEIDSKRMKDLEKAMHELDEVKKIMETAPKKKQPREGEEFEREIEQQPFKEEISERGTSFRGPTEVPMNVEKTQKEAEKSMEELGIEGVHASGQQLMSEQKETKPEGAEPSLLIRKKEQMGEEKKQVEPTRQETKKASKEEEEVKKARLKAERKRQKAVKKLEKGERKFKEKELGLKKRQAKLKKREEKLQRIEEQLKELRQAVEEKLKETQEEKPQEEAKPMKTEQVSGEQVPSEEFPTGEVLTEVFTEDVPTEEENPKEMERFETFLGTKGKSQDLIRGSAMMQESKQEQPEQLKKVPESESKKAKVIQIIEEAMQEGKPEEKPEESKEQQEPKQERVRGEPRIRSIPIEEVS